MRRLELDRILTQMLEVHGPVSDLNFTVGRPLQVEHHGRLVPVGTDPPIERLAPFQAETIALALIGGDQRLTETLVRTGSCDLSSSWGPRPGSGGISSSNGGTPRSCSDGWPARSPPWRGWACRRSSPRWPRSETDSSSPPGPRAAGWVGLPGRPPGRGDPSHGPGPPGSGYLRCPDHEPTLPAGLASGRSPRSPRG